MKTKRKGNRNERRSMRLLEAAGYTCTRAAASLGVFDITGIGAVDILLVQVKSNRWQGGAETARHKILPGAGQRPETYSSVARSAELA